MNTTKEIKTLLEEVRLRLDEESRHKVEPILRGILDAAKPRTITEVQYRGDPKDQAQIEGLRATIASKDDLINALQSKTARLPLLRKQRSTGMIQTFFLAEKITRTASGGYDVQQAGLVLLNLVSFGEPVMMPGLIVLGREDASSEVPISLRLDLWGDDGRRAGQPDGARVNGTFLAGHHFFTLLANIGFVFPKPGHYRFDITMENAPEESVYHYAIHLGTCAPP